ncbi:sensor histidine kinase [Foetidibacter luteolus]|uniref:sensor histidine kinase n=1 Tax=Foetidibacter luteolus TaxID=2608880 RepID=UPI001A988DEB|nr:histidine kinase [Foetidibacter luteolus]
MKPSPFIFSNQRKYRLRRHIAFWVFWWLFMGFLYAFMPNRQDYFTEQLPLSMVDALLYMPAHIFLTYSLIYFIIPRYLVKGKYLPAALLVVAAFLLTALISNFIFIQVLSKVNVWLFPSAPRIQEKKSFFLQLLAGLRGGITVGGIGAAIKLMKYFYFKEQQNLQLQKENAEAQLQMLKAQVHPHFLFNTLNNIYAFTQQTSPEASRLVMDLSDILRYMLYEGIKPTVPLEKEIKMIEEFIRLEQVRYGNMLELHVNLPEDTRGYYIAPLLLIPFVENCFKHGISDMYERPWLSLDIVLDDGMTMKLLNGKPARNAARKPPPGIGIQNVRKRLQLLYPGAHELTIKEEDEMFIVNLKLRLEKRAVKPTAAYAEVNHN